MNAATLLRDEVVTIGTLVATARQMVATGRLVDLSPLAARVQALCGRVSAMPVEQGRDLKDDLVGLAVKIDGLGNDLRERLSRAAANTDIDSESTG